MTDKENPSFTSPSDGKRLSFNATPSAPPSDGLDDLQHLPRADDASLLEALRARYEQRRVYTHSGSRVILSVNPYSWETSLPLYTAERRATTAGGGAGAPPLPPHLYAVAELARRRRAGDDGIRAEAQTQALLVSGESGAGKTEAVKILLAYVCQHDHARCAELPQQLVEINPLLEAFGNACTALNANSSRFGKLLSLQYDRDGRLCGGAITPYLLEKVRVVRHAADERSFHVFYQMLRGLPRAELARLRLAEPDAAEVAEHRYLRSPADTPALGAAVSPAQPPSGGSGRSSVGFTPASALATPAGRAYAATSAAGAAGEGSGRTSPTSTPMHLSPTFGEEASEEEGGITAHSVAAWRATARAAEAVGIDAAELRGLTELLAGVLHLGDVRFQIGKAADTETAASVTAASRPSLAAAAELWQVSEDELRRAVCSRIFTAQGVDLECGRSPAAARASADALAKRVYAAVFSWLIGRLNTVIAAAPGGGGGGRRGGGDRAARHLRLRVLRAQRLRAAIDQLRERGDPAAVLLRRLPRHRGRVRGGGRRVRRRRLRGQRRVRRAARRARAAARPAATVGGGGGARQRIGRQLRAEAVDDAPPPPGVPSVGRAQHASQKPNATGRQVAAGERDALCRRSSARAAAAARRRPPTAPAGRRRRSSSCFGTLLGTSSTARRVGASATTTHASRSTLGCSKRRRTA